VSPDDLLSLLRDLYEDKRAQKVRHEASALKVGQYDFNNTYQYVINREAAHEAWLREAIESIGGVVPDLPADAPGPSRATDARPGAPAAHDDAQAARALVERWESKISAVAHARHRRMLEVILGETREHQRFFEHASAGRTDLLGRRTSGSEPVGRVLSTRWVE
jgi:hypothetical protein